MTHILKALPLEGRESSRGSSPRGHQGRGWRGRAAGAGEQRRYWGDPSPALCSEEEERALLLLPSPQLLIFSLPHVGQKQQGTGHQDQHPASADQSTEGRAPGRAVASSQTETEFPLTPADCSAATGPPALPRPQPSVLASSRGCSSRALPGEPAQLLLQDRLNTPTSEEMFSPFQLTGALATSKAGWFASRLEAALTPDIAGPLVQSCWMCPRAVIPSPLTALGPPCCHSSTAPHQTRCPAALSCHTGDSQWP